jgi:hypothetical protein
VARNDPVPLGVLGSAVRCALEFEDLSGASSQGYVTHPRGIGVHTSDSGPYVV